MRLKGNPMGHDLKGDLKALIWWAISTGIGIGFFAVGMDNGHTFAWSVGLASGIFFFFCTVRMYRKTLERHSATIVTKK